MRRILVPGAFAAALALCAAAASAWAFQALPAGKQVNDDRAAGIDPTISVSADGPSSSDVVGGSLVAGKPAVPWAIFRQRETEEITPPHDQIFARSFAKGAWTTRGAGTVGGRSSAAPQFPGSLNFDQGTDGEAPSIDFAGTGRTVPWATWYENTSGKNFENNNVFASRFDNTGDANQGKWIFGGQARGTGEKGMVQVPSLNIDTNQSAENPSVAGGSAVDPSKPGPWVTFQEFSGLEGREQIFAERPIGPGAANCDGVKPEGVMVDGHVPAIGGFCWQQTGVPRAEAEPTLNVDPSREGLEPDIAFAGTNDGVPWIVWYEEGTSSNGLDENEQVFAAKAVSDGEGATGGFHWVAVGSGLSAPLDRSGPHSIGKCAESKANEEMCSLNRDPHANAEKPRVAAGTMNPANPAVPWVAWDEEFEGMKRVFVSHLVGSGAEAHFELANGGKPVSPGRGDATQPDITFSGNTPYVTWREEVGGSTRASTGHFSSPASFVLDENEIPLTPTAQADVREPISSACIATPFNHDGASCQGGALGTPFFLTTAGTSTRGLFATAYEPEAPATGAATGIGATGATVSGTVNPRGASVAASFQFGTTTAYGQTTAAQRIGPASAAVPFSAQLTGLPSGTTIHYRSVATSDFGTFVGADRVLTTAAVPPPTPPPPAGVTAAAHGSVLRVTTSGSAAKVRVRCIGSGGAVCHIVLRLTALSGAHASHRGRHVLLVGRASIALAAGQTKTVTLSLNRTGRRLLVHGRPLRARLTVQQLGAGAVRSAVVTFGKHRASPGRPA
jgi:hypothetical protein